MKRSPLVRSVWNGLAGIAVTLAAVSVSPQATAQQGQDICQRYTCYWYGNSGPAVADIQRALGVPVDGFYGVQTENAVRYFQRDRQLVFVDGIAGPETLTQLGLGYLVGSGGGGGYPDGYYPGGYYPDGGYIGGGGGYRPPEVERAPYIVVVPGSDYTLLRQVRSYVPGAYLAEASPGPYIQAGAFYNRDRAEEQSQYLRSRGFDARVAYQP